MPVFTNQAALTYGTNRSALSNTVTGNLLDVITAIKTSVDLDYRMGDDITYVVNLYNAGPTDYTNLTVTDNLGAYQLTTGTPTTVYPLTYLPGTIQYYQNGRLQAAPAVTDGPPMTVTGINVPANGHTQLIYLVRANQSAPLLITDGAITNTVTVTGDAVTPPVTASHTIPYDTVPALSIVKALNPEQVVGNEPLTYTFTITNASPTAAAAAQNVVLADTFNPPLTITGVTLDGTAITQGTDYTYDAAGNFATVPGRITVPAATYTQDPATGVVRIEPGTAVLRVTGTM